MSLQSAADVPLLISSPNSSSERRVSPSWSIAQLKARLEPITGVPASSQQLSLRVGSQDAVALIALDEEQTRLAAFPLQPYAEITVSASSAFSLNGRRSPVLDQSTMRSSRELPHLSNPGSPLYFLVSSTLHLSLAVSCVMPPIFPIRCQVRRRGCGIKTAHVCIIACPAVPLLSSTPQLCQPWQSDPRGSHPLFHLKPRSS